MKNALTKKYFWIALGALLMLVFLAQNNHPVTIEFFFWTLASANLFILLLIFFFIGAAAGFFGHQVYRMKNRSKLQRKENEAKQRDSVTRYPGSTRSHPTH